MDFLVVLTRQKTDDGFSKENIHNLEEIFKGHLKPKQTTLTLDEFKGIMPSKNQWFLERVFKIFDIDGDGTISMAEFLDTMYKYAGSTSDVEKVQFLFKVYDIDGKNYNQFYITDCQFLAYLCNGLVPSVIYYKPLSYEANFLQA